MELLNLLEKTLWVEPIKIFSTKKNRQVRIYNIKKYRERENQ